MKVIIRNTRSMSNRYALTHPAPNRKKAPLLLCKNRPNLFKHSINLECFQLPINSKLSQLRVIQSQNNPQPTFGLKCDITYC